MAEVLPEEHESLLDILGNETRRRILSLLADEPRYFNQLSKDLGVSQQAVLKHLELLENAKMVTAYAAKSNLGAPDRKYYKLNKRMHISVDITNDVADFRIEEIEKSDPPRLVGDELLPLERKVSKIAMIDDLETLVRLSRPLLEEIDAKIEEAEDTKLHLFELKQRLMEKIHERARSSIDQTLERKILYSLVESYEGQNIEMLSEEFDVREKEIEQALTELFNRFSIRTRRLLFRDLLETD